MVRIFLTLLLTLLSLSASPIELKHGSKGINVVPHSSYLLEEDTLYTPLSIVDHLDKFTPSDQSIYNFGFIEKTLWIAFEVDATRTRGEPWILRIDNPHIDYYELYRLENAKPVLVGSGGDTRTCRRSFECRTYWERLHDAHEPVTYVLLIRTEGSLQIPIVAQPLQASNHSEALSNLLFGLYYGVLLLLLVYNLVLFVVVKEVHYINYLLFLGSYMLFSSVLTAWGESGSGRKMSG